MANSLYYFVSRSVLMFLLKDYFFAADTLADNYQIIKTIIL